MSDEKKNTEMAREGGLIPRSHLIRSWLIWETFPQCCYNYERMMGQSMAHSFAPVIRDLYPDDAEKRKETMRRESEFFNVHIEFGSCIPGMAIAMEECGMVKINIASDLRRAFINSVAMAQEANSNEANLAHVLLDARAAVTRVAKKTQLAINGLPYEE